MKEPDPPDDLEQTILETFDELHAEAKIVPMVFLFPPEVIEWEVLQLCSYPVVGSPDAPPGVFGLQSI